MTRSATVEPKKKDVKDIFTNEQQFSPSALGCESIRECAYYKWEAAGCPCCDGIEFWLQAEAELAADRPLSQSN